MNAPRITVFVMLALSLATACGQKEKPPPPTVVNITLQTSPDVNPDVEGRASPIDARIYYLVSLEPFGTTGFFELFEQDQALLGDNLLGREEVQLAVGEQRNFSRELNDRVRFIGVVAAYRDIERARWRASIEILPNRTTPLTVDFTGAAVSISVR